MRKFILLIAAVLVLGIAAIGLYILRPSPEASAPIQATSIDTQAPSTPAEQAMTPTQDSDPVMTPAASSGTLEAMSGTVVYQISQSESEVSFTLDEVLRGRPFQPIGATDQVAGEIQLDFDGNTAQLGPIQVNARTLKTDSPNRDRAINNLILDTANHEFITFTPLEITGLPEQGEFGQPVQFQIRGDLTIRDISQEVTFNVTATLVSADRLEGSGTATVLRSDFGLLIPNVPFVADVSDEVRLEIRFVAVPV